jgi:hypothetical protein
LQIWVELNTIMEDFETVGYRKNKSRVLTFGSKVFPPVKSFDYTESKDGLYWISLKISFNASSNLGNEN